MTRAYIYLKNKYFEFKKRKKLNLLIKEIKEGTLNLETLQFGKLNSIQIEIIILFLEGKSRKEIAKILFHDPATISTLMKNFNLFLNSFYDNLTMDTLRRLIVKYYSESEKTISLEKQTIEEIKLTKKINLNAIDLMSKEEQIKRDLFWLEIAEGLKKSKTSL